MYKSLEFINIVPFTSNWRMTQGGKSNIFKKGLNHAKKHIVFLER